MFDPMFVECSAPIHRKVPWNELATAHVNDLQTWVADFIINTI